MLVDMCMIWGGIKVKLTVHNMQFYVKNDITVP